MSKRTALILIALLIVIEAGGAWVLGRSIEGRVDAAMAKIGSMSPYIHVVDSQFHRGWFRSEQDVTVEAFGNAAGQAAAIGAFPLAPQRVTIHNVIQHGPICGLTCVGLAQIHSHLQFDAPLQGFLQSIFGPAEPLSLRTRLGFFGGGSGTLSSPAIAEVALKDGSRISSQGFSVSSSYGANNDSYSIRGALPHLTFKGTASQQFELSGMTIDIDSRRALRTLYTGTSAIDVGSLALGGIGPAGTVTVKDLRAASSSSMADGFLSLTSKMGMESVVTAPLTLTGMHFDFTFHHLQAEALEQISAASKAQNQAPTGSPMERLGAITAAIKAPAVALLSNQPEISVDRVSLATAAGSALLTGSIKTHDITAQDFADGASPMTLLQKVDADMDLTADDAFLTSLPGGAQSLAQLQMFVGQGLLTHEANKFHTLIGFHRGQVTFNGKPFGPAGAAGPAVK